MLRRAHASTPSITKTGLALVSTLVLVSACAPHVPPPAAAPRASAAPVATSALSHAASSASAAPPLASSMPPPAVPRPPVPVPASSFAATKTDASWAACLHARKPSSKTVTADVTANAAACADGSHMKPDGAPITSKQSDRDPPQSFPLEARAGRCYRAFAQAGDGITDLHVVLRDSAGIEVAHDDADRAGPVVTEDGAVCFQKDDHASVVVSVGMGSGEFALQIWRD